MKMVKQVAQLLAAVTMLFVTMGALPVPAQTLDEAVAAYVRGDFGTALRGSRIHAEQGNAVAQHLLGFMYDNGDPPLQLGGADTTTVGAVSAAWLRRH